jgi:hypothetical protein
MAAKVGPDPPGQYEPFDRLKALASLLLALEQVLLAFLRLLKLMGC